MYTYTHTYKWGPVSIKGTLVDVINDHPKPLPFANGRIVESLPDSDGGLACEATRQRFAKLTSREKNISLPKALLKMIFLYPRWYLVYVSSLLSVSGTERFQSFHPFWPRGYRVLWHLCCRSWTS